ncbi:hypothetical protein BV25DRAFT_361413 [Artomyces pyxidatus]|uniref:Uncharacterized protein n=1 Tax=Artomyces pyxidatus TaxID=48021 RepID=A0ACB8T5K3_9AGAM|nr:hypothetical protein BV25DRAFT_361413 [Artomyces pyxidatus]
MLAAWHAFSRKIFSRPCLRTASSLVSSLAAQPEDRPVDQLYSPALNEILRDRCRIKAQLHVGKYCTPRAGSRRTPHPPSLLGRVAHPCRGRQERRRARRRQNPRRAAPAQRAPSTTSSRCCAASAASARRGACSPARGCPCASEAGRARRAVRGGAHRCVRAIHEVRWVLYTLIEISSLATSMAPWPCRTAPTTGRRTASS